MNRKNRRLSLLRRAPESGLTLVEIMVVLIIIGIVMTWLGSRVFGAGDKAKAKITDLKIKQIGSAIEQYQLQYNGLPDSIEDLARCNERSGSDCVPIMKEDELRDAWDTPFIYTLEDGNRRYRIKSLGADKREGGDGVNSDFFGTGP